MSTVTPFPSFKGSYKRLKENQNNIYVVEYYHRDMPGEPTFSIVDSISGIFSKIGDDSYISIRFDGGTDLTFTEENYNTNLSDGDVVFSSKFDDETYCIIEFR